VIPTLIWWSWFGSCYPNRSADGFAARVRKKSTSLATGYLLNHPFLDQILSHQLDSYRNQIQIFAILALGLNIVVGSAGLLDSPCWLASSPQLNIEWNFWLVIWIAAAVAAWLV